MNGLIPEDATADGIEEVITDDGIIIEGDQGHDQIEDENEKNEGEKEDKKENAPKKEGRAKKRIQQLVNQKKEKDVAIETLQRELEILKQKTAEREKKEAEIEYTAKINNIKEKKKAAFEAGDYDLVTDLDEQYSNIIQSYRPPQTAEVDPEKYFSSQNAWYGVDMKRTYVARQISNEVFSNPDYQNLGQKEKLDIVSKKTDTLFRENPYRATSPTDGAGSAPPAKIVRITRDELELVRRMYPGESSDETKKRAIELKKRILSKGGK